MLALTFQIHHDRVALEARRIGQVVPWVPLSRPAGSPAWLAGILVYEQAAIPVIDLHQLVGAAACPARLSSRIILVPWQRGARPPSWLGLLAANVSELRELPGTPRAQEVVPQAEQADLGPVVIDHGATLRILDVDRLVTPAMQAQLDGVCAV